MVNLLYTQTKDGFIVAIDTDRLQSGSMASNGGDSMAPDEMYLMLQADMVSIKQQEQILQSEIEEIATKFHNLLETCGIDSDTGSGTMAPPSTPSFLKTTSGSLTHVTNLETPTFLKQTPGRTTYSLSDSSDDDESRSMFPDCMVDAVVNKTDGLPLDISTLSNKTLVVDRNSNYLDSPHNESNENTPVIEAIPSLEKISPTDSTTSTSSSSSSSHKMSSSDGYPKSDESSDNQIVPECYDLDKEFMYRLKYYSDFTLDRQRKINSMVASFGGASDGAPCAVTEDILTRHVEGKESSPEKPVFVKPVLPPPSTSSGSDYVSTPTSRHHSRKERTRRQSRTSRKRSSQPLASSTMLDDSFSSSGSSRGSHRGSSLIPKASSTMICDSGSSSGSSRRNRTNGSNPRACSTMLNESFLSSGSAGSSGSKHRSSSIPMANSTMIHDLPEAIPYVGEPTISVIRHHSDTNLNSDNDCESVYTWSIHDSDNGSDRDISLEESYMRKVTNSARKTSNKPPLPPCKRVRSGSISSRDSDCEVKCQDHQLHKLLGEPCSKTILESVSAIEPSETCREGILFVESLCDETTCAVPKSNTIPRSSTRVKLQDKSSGSSSMEARRASLPDLTSVCTSNNNDDVSVHDSSCSISEDDITAMSERPDVQGKSSSSNDNPNAGGISHGSANVDSILTDSPTSVCSSGINAPYNSPGTNASSSSRVSCSTTSDARSSDSNINTRAPPVTLVPRNIPVPQNSPKVQNIEIPANTEGAVFKVPKQTQPLRNLFRFRRKSKTPDMKTSTPKESVRGANIQTQSKRQLFPSNGTANLQSEAKVMDKKAVIRKFKKFSDSFRQRDRSGKPQIQTLANL
ncbi:uncharacterized protein LOC132748575 isoform X3 [Ruditapes philippinarum]|uniref:uncharacterized protein LOC132748575 isoform X3 n=1 Tax=Ruditapes philippinarum TaxID=129788 RepID=UPI00295ABC98|nr:uncharacterized protein LOC132748575 isoform X3 [Ruditapes philippinarum]